MIALIAEREVNTPEESLAPGKCVDWIIHMQSRVTL